MTAASPVQLEARALSAWYGSRRVLEDITLSIEAGRVTAIIGPSGCGKSTFLRCLNRMHELIPGATMRGTVLLGCEDVYASDVDPAIVRRRVGMVFHRANPFPTMSVRENVLSGLRLGGDRPQAVRDDEVVERSLVRAALWDEVKDRLHAPGVSLSHGQQQRLCIARALAVEPEVLLMDEPCAALDPIATTRIEELIHDLRARYAVLVVTHNLQQAARISQRTAFLLQGSLIEYADTSDLFTSPADKRTEDYITGKFG